MMSVSYRFITGIYIIIPAALLVVLLDFFFFDYSIRANLPKSPNTLALFNLFFVLPHIIASSLIFLDRQYLYHYKNKLGVGILFAALLAFLLPSIVSIEIVLLINGVLTIYHVLAQQFGLTAAVAKSGGFVFQAWKAIGLISGALVYYLFYFSEKMTSQQSSAVHLAIVILLLLFSVSSCLYSAKIKSRIGRLYLWSNWCLILSAFFCIESRYFFLAVIIPRCVHDITAFAFYISHDVNRNHSTPRNWTYKLISSLPLFKKTPRYLITPIVAIIIGFGITKLNILAFVNFITLFHYWTESFSWKTGTPHRAHIKWV